MSYLLSIVLPTKDRIPYLKHFVNLINSFNSNEIELIIQDNTVNNIEILELLAKLKNPNIKYFHSSEPISIIENSDKSILNSTGKYVCFMGDDDGVTGHIVDCVKWMEENNVDVLKSSSALYIWPNGDKPGPFDMSSSFSVKNYSGSITLLDPLVVLKKMLKRGGAGLHDMPKVYNGIARRETLNEIYAITGTFFPGPSPDIANAVALCFVTKKFVVIDFPIIIGGRSKTQGGYNENNSKNRNKIENISHLPKDTEKNWESFIPKVWVPTTILVESTVKALKRMKQEQFINEYLDKEKMLANFIYADKDLMNLGIAISENKMRLYCLLALIFVKGKFQAIYSLILYRFFGIRYIPVSHTLSKRKLYLRVHKNILDINHANSLIMKKMPRFILK